MAPVAWILLVIGNYIGNCNPICYVCLWFHALLSGNVTVLHKGERFRLIFYLFDYDASILLSVK
jgi:hypothetical protein